jgi:phthalate 4,5-dioxygenase
VPYVTMVASIPFSSGLGMFIPIDDENCWRYFTAPKRRLNPRNLGGANLFSVAPFSTPISGRRDGIIPRLYTAENDYQIDREAQRNGIFSGVSDFVSQDLMVTESMGPIYDRSQEQLGSTDRAISRMRHILISAAKGLASGKEPPAIGERDYRSIRGAEKILEPDEDWRLLGTDDDPVVQEAFGIESPIGADLTEVAD